jgi:tetratricopeptide (TPR) repeat protein
MNGIDSKYWALGFILFSILLGWVALSLLVLLLGDLAAVNGAYQRAIRFYNGADKLRWRSARLYHNRGNLLYRMGQLDQAAQDFDNSIRRYPRRLDAYLSRGAVQMAKGFNPEALADYDRAITQGLQSAEAYCSRGIVRQRCGDEASAIEDFQQAIQRKPELFYPHYYLAALLAAQGNATGALASVARAIQLRPQYPPLYYLQGKIQAENHQAQAATESFQAAQKWEERGEADRYLSDERGHFYRAWAMEHLGKSCSNTWQLAKELATRHNNQPLLADLQARAQDG